MYSPDQADIDPRNPANFPEVIPALFTICPNQFSDDDAELLKGFPEVSTSDEGEARDEAFRMARHIMKSVTITYLNEHGGEIDSIEIQPRLKLA